MWQPKCRYWQQIMKHDPLLRLTAQSLHDPSLSPLFLVFLPYVQLFLRVGGGNNTLSRRPSVERSSLSSTSHDSVRLICSFNSRSSFVDTHVDSIESAQPTFIVVLR
mmetsp:Transcript_27378/g.49724  ORF Transcript_27378/g.49724 Transcript_27378/m.49724 type:complete len:107 (-) Transcript_27378:152-472(-)